MHHLRTVPCLRGENQPSCTGGAAAECYPGQKKFGFENKIDRRTVFACVIGLQSSESEESELGHTSDTTTCFKFRMTQTSYRPKKKMGRL
jgi:hypothetical protein